DWSSDVCYSDLANRFPKLKAATSSNALAGPIPLISLSSLTEQRLSSANDLYLSSSSRATSITFIPRRPVRSRIAINSALVRASGPRASNFSRGRSSCGISRILSCAINQNSWRAELLRRRTRGLAEFDPPLKGISHAKLIEHVAQGVTEGEQRIGVGIRRDSVQRALRFANQV